jgi:hypothetical protein
MNTELYLDSRTGIQVDGDYNGRYFILTEPLVAPPGSQLTIQITSATVPLTHWALNDANNDLHLVFSDSTQQSLSLLVGNRSIDLIIAKLNLDLLHGWVATYDETTNRITFAGGTLGFEIGPYTTCQTALGVVVGDVSGVDITGTSPVATLLARNGVDISGTACFFVNNNLYTQNIVPFTRNASTVLGRIPITRAPLEIERWVNTTGVVNITTNNFLSLLYIELLDDLLENSIQLHGGHWSITAVVSYTPPSDTVQSFGDINPPPITNGPEPVGPEA